jgi:hypothetical protein
LVRSWLFSPTSTSGTKKEPDGVEVVPIVTPCKNARPSDSKEYNESAFDFFGNSPPVTAAVSAIGIRLPHPMLLNIARIADLSNTFFIFFNFFLKMSFLYAIFGITPDTQKVTQRKELCYGSK